MAESLHLQPGPTGLIHPVLRARRWASPAVGVQGRSLPVLMVALSLWLAVHAYGGLHIDARIYMGRALADLAPDTIGRDMLFAYDGQSGFSVFRVLARCAVANVGLERASILLALAAALSWFAGAALLTRQLAPGRLRFALLACLATLPDHYGGFLTNPYGEALAIPRPFAEAAVMSGFALVLAGRSGWAFAALAMALVFHPLMALGGFAVVLLMLASQDRRWAAALIAPPCAALGAVLLHLPVASRALQIIDPAWRTILREHHTYLFPSLWPAATDIQTAVQLVTCVVSAVLVSGRLRRLFACVAAVCVGALLVSLVADVSNDLLLVQLQPWRALWLGAVFGALGFAVSAVALWRSPSDLAKPALSLLALAWLSPTSTLGVACVAGALALTALARWRPDMPVRPWVMQGAAWAVVCVAGCKAVAAVRMTGQLMAGLPQPDLFALAPAIRASGLAALVAPPAALALVLGRSARVDRTCAALAPWAAVLLAPLAGAAWLEGEPAALRTSPSHWAGVSRLIEARTGPVLWLDGDVEPWTVMGRAAWAGDLQGASMVFSRPQAMLWSRRTQALVDLGLASEQALRPFDDLSAKPLTRPKPEAIAALCRRADRPAWIVDHLLPGESAPTLPGARVWRLRDPVNLLDGPQGYARVNAYVVTPCGTAGAT